MNSSHAGMTATQPVRTTTRRRNWPAVLLALLALALIGIALWQLIVPGLPLRFEERRLGSTPVTIIQPRILVTRTPAVVIAHGFAASQQMMLPYAVTLARAGYTVLIFDLPGHGRNSEPLRADIADREGRYRQLHATLTDVVALAHERGNGDVGLLGHSLGSELVTRYAMEQEDIAAVVGVSLVYEGTTATSPANLLVLTGGFEAALRPIAQAIADESADGNGESGVIYGDFAAGTARRVVFVPNVEHIGVLFSPVALAAALEWLQQAMPLPDGGSGEIYIDDRILWLALLYGGSILLFWPLSGIVDRVHTPVAPERRRAGRTWWWVSILLPIAVTPVALRLLPLEGLLPILVGGPLAAFFAIYGLASLLGLLIYRWRGPAVQWPQRAGVKLPIMLAGALLMVGYVLLSNGLPAQFFVLNYFPPPLRLPIFGLVWLAMLPYFLADEWLTRAPGAPRGGYVISKIAMLTALALAIALNLNQLFFLILIAPLLLGYFIVYGMYSGWMYRRSGLTLIGALANSVIFAWIIAVTFPLVA
jgi:pimeloyl-ACP methyl ester carboxylesterase